MSTHFIQYEGVFFVMLCLCVYGTYLGNKYAVLLHLFIKAPHRNHLHHELNTNFFDCHFIQYEGVLVVPPCLRQKRVLRLRLWFRPEQRERSGVTLLAICALFSCQPPRHRHLCNLIVWPQGSPTPYITLYST